MGSQACISRMRSFSLREVLYDIEQPKLRYGASAELAKALLLPADELTTECFDTTAPYIQPSPD